MSIINDETETADDVLFFPEMIIPIRMIVDNSGAEAIQADESVDESNSDDNNTETDIIK
jgi:hypothetical protein